MKLFFKNIGFRKYFFNTSWLFAEKALRILVGLLVGIWVTRYLGPTRFGILSFSQSFVALFVAFAGLGIGGILVRELVKGQLNSSKLLGTSFGLMLTGSLTSILVLLILIYLLTYTSETELIILVIGFSSIFQCFDVIDFYFQSQVLSRYVVYVKVLCLFISSLVIILLIINNAELVYFAWAILFNNAILAFGFIYIFIAFGKLPLTSFKFKKKFGARLLNESWPYMLSGILITIYMKIDQVMIKELVNDYAVGQYAVAVRLSEAWYFVPIVISSSVFPAIVNSKQQGSLKYENRLSNLYALMIALAVCISIPASYFSEFIVRFLYGNQYGGAAPVLMIHIWASVFVFVGVASGKWLLAESLQFYVAMNAFLGVIINILLNFILIPDFGIIGAAWATLVSQAFAAYFSMLLWHKTRENFFRISKAMIVAPGSLKAVLSK